MCLKQRIQKKTVISTALASLRGPENPLVAMTRAMVISNIVDC
jgi:hypothetical protein